MGVVLTLGGFGVDIFFGLGVCLFAGVIIGVIVVGSSLERIGGFVAASPVILEFS